MLLSTLAFVISAQQLGDIGVDSSKLRAAIVRELDATRKDELVWTWRGGVDRFAVDGSLVYSRTDQTLSYRRKVGVYFEGQVLSPVTDPSLKWLATIDFGQGSSKDVDWWLGLLAMKGAERTRLPAGGMWPSQTLTPIRHLSRTVDLGYVENPKDLSKRLLNDLTSHKEVGNWEWSYFTFERNFNYVITYSRSRGALQFQATSKHRIVNYLFQPVPDGVFADLLSSSAAGPEVDSQLHWLDALLRGEAQKVNVGGTPKPFSMPTSSVFDDLASAPVFKLENASPLASASRTSARGSIDIRIERIEPNSRVGITWRAGGQELWSAMGHPWTVFAIADPLVYWADYGYAVAGGTIRCYDVRLRQERWRTALPNALGIAGHSGYSTFMNLDVTPQGILVYSHEAGGDYVVMLDPDSGKVLGSKVLSKGGSPEGGQR